MNKMVEIVVAQVEGDCFCRSCDKLVDEKDFALCCEGLCESWFHIKCASILKKDYKRFMFPWVISLSGTVEHIRLRLEFARYQKG